MTYLCRRTTYLAFCESKVKTKSNGSFSHRSHNVGQEKSWSNGVLKETQHPAQQSEKKTGWMDDFDRDFEMAAQNNRKTTSSPFTELQTRAPSWAQSNEWHNQQRVTHGPNNPLSSGGIGIGGNVGVGPVNVGTGLGLTIPGLGGLGSGSPGGNNFFGISSGIGVGVPGVGPIGISSGLGIGK